MNRRMVRYVAAATMVAGCVPMVAYGQWAASALNTFRVADGAATQTTPRIKPTADGGCYVSWYETSTYDVRLQRLDGAGVEQWAHNGILIADRVNGGTVTGGGIAVAPDGSCFVAFDDQTDPVNPSVRQAVVQKVSSTGTKLWGAGGANVSLTSGNINMIPGPMVGALPDGGCILAWGGGTSPATIQMMRLDSTGAPASGWAAPKVISEAPIAVALNDIQVVDNSGSFVVSWNRTSGNNRYLYAQKFDGAGAPQWNSGFPVDIFSRDQGGAFISNGYNPTFVSDGAGGAVFGWYEGTSGFLHANIQHVLSDGTVKFTTPEGFQNDMWSYNGATTIWARPNLNPSNQARPVGRYRHAMAYDSVRKRTVLFGGTDANGSVLGDTWEWKSATPNPVGWTSMAIAAPSARDRLGMAFDVARSRIVIFGGADGAGVAQSDTWTYDGVTWTQVMPATTPPARYGQAMAYDSARNVVVMFGGQGASGKINDTWEWNGVDWTQVMPASSPSIREGAGMTFDTVNNKLVLFGGLDSSSVLLQDTWLFDGTNWVVQSPATVPPARAYFGMASDNIGTQTVPNLRVVIEGGAAGPSAAYEWSGTNWVAKPMRMPSSRAGVAMVYQGDPTTTTSFYAAVFGGRSSNVSTPIASVSSSSGNYSARKRIGGVVDYNRTEGSYFLLSKDSKTTPESDYGVFVQKFSSSGALLWGADGVYVVNPVVPNYNGSSITNSIVADTTGGCIIAGVDNRGTTTTTSIIYCTRVDSEGGIAWNKILNTDATTGKTNRMSMCLSAGSDDAIVAFGWNIANGDDDIGIARVASSDGSPAITPECPVFAVDAPAAIGVCQGDTVVIPVTITGTPNLGIRWQKGHKNTGNFVFVDDGATGGSFFTADGSAHLGTTTQTLRITNAKPMSANEQKYQCTVFNACPGFPVVSTTTIVTVDPSGCPSDYNCDGTTTIDDLFLYINGYFTGAPRADFNHTDGVTIDDLFLYINAYFQSTC